jgi:hypothetical protein
MIKSKVTRQIRRGTERGTLKGYRGWYRLVVGTDATSKKKALVIQKLLRSNARNGPSVGQGHQ